MSNCTLQRMWLEWSQANDPSHIGSKKRWLNLRSASVANKLLARWIENWDRHQWIPWQSLVLIKKKKQTSSTPRFGKKNDQLRLISKEPNWKVWSLMNVAGFEKTGRSHRRSIARISYKRCCNDDHIVPISVELSWTVFSSERWERSDGKQETR